MDVSITLRGPIRSFEESGHLRFQVESVADLLRQIQSKNQKLFFAIFLPNGEVNPYVKIFWNSNEIELSDLFSAGETETVAITVMSIMSGG